MTLRSRRKQPTTARNTPGVNRSDSRRRRSVLQIIFGAALLAGAATLAAGAAAWADEGTSNSPVDNPLRSAPVAVQAVAMEQVAAPVAAEVAPQRVSPVPGRSLQWRPLRQPEPAAERTASRAALVAPAPLRTIAPQPSNYRLTAAQQPVEERSLLQPELPGAPPATEPAPGVAPAPAAAAAPARPYIDPPAGAAAPPPTEVAPMPLPLTNGEAKKLDEKIAYDCKAAREELKRKKLSSIDLDIEVRARKGFEVPRDCRLEDDPFQPRNWEGTDFVWTASGLCHKPLYFEERQLERYGHSTGPYTQPLVSGAHFFGSVLMLPYNMGLKLPGECEYALGHYETGSCAPYMIPALPITARAVLFEAGAAAGLVYLLP